VELVFAAQPARELQAWREQAGQPELELVMPVGSRQESALAVPREAERQELALPALTAAKPVLAPQRPEPLVLLQPELVEQAQERAAWRQPVEEDRQVFAERRAQQLP